MNVSVIRGRMVANPELKTTSNGTSITRFTVAVERRRGDDGADFIRCVAFGKSAEFASQYLHKGDRVGVIGRLQVQQYEKDGEKREAWSVAVDQFDLIETKKEAEARNAPAQSAPNPAPHGTATGTQTGALNGTMNGASNDMPTGAQTNTPTEQTSTPGAAQEDEE